MADRHDSRTGRDEHLSPTVDPGPKGEDTAAAQKAEAAADKAETDAIVTRRKAEDQARVDAIKGRDAAETARKARVAKGVEQSIGFLSAGTVSYADHPDPAAGRTRTLLIGGANYEHVDTDADGVWLYRAM